MRNPSVDFFLEPMVASVDYKGPQEVIIISEDPVGPCFTIAGEGCFFFFLILSISSEDEPAPYCGMCFILGM